MADYISRDYTVENMENYPWDTEHDKNAAIHLVRELVPAADVRPVVRGRWEWNKHYGLYQCSNCHNSYVDIEWVKEGKWKYCPMCGRRLTDG